MADRPVSVRLVECLDDLTAISERQSAAEQISYAPIVRKLAAAVASSVEMEEDESWMSHRYPDGTTTPSQWRHVQVKTAATEAEAEGLALADHYIESIGGNLYGPVDFGKRKVLQGESPVPETRTVEYLDALGSAALNEHIDNMREI